MRWNHLPAGGSIPDQDPVLWDKFRYIWQEQAKEQAAEQKRNERKKNGAGNKNAARPPRRSR